MIAANYGTKAQLKASVGKALDYTETSLFGPEYKSTGHFPVVGPSYDERVWYAEVVMRNGLIIGVR